jgi:hypothetical protein
MRPQKTPAEHAADLVALEQLIANHLEAGQIDKPSYEALKYKVDRAIEGTSKVIAEEHLYGKGGDIYNLGDNHWGALVQAIPLHYGREVVSLGNKLTKAKKMAAHAFWKDCAAYYGRYKTIAENLLTLKDKIVSTAARRELKKTAEQEERKAKFTEYKTLVDVLQEHLDAYVTRAGEMAADTFEHWMEELGNFEWDLDKAAPEPTREDEYHVMQAKRERRGHFIAITDAGGRKGLVRKFSIVKKAEHVAREKDAAHGSYMAWIFKMIQKIGQPVTAAEMSGNPWINSTVSVVTQDGGRQVWHTKMKINYSKYQRPFYQFPSLRVDDGAKL